MKSGMLPAAIAACSLLLAVPASAQVVKIGILNDQSGVYADYGGKYSVEAARMAVEDFGDSVIGQHPGGLRVTSRRKVLECPHAQVARRDTGQNGSREDCFPQHPFARLKETATVGDAS